MSLLDHIVVPVADETDAAVTAAVLTSHLSEIKHITVVHVIEKGGGVVDKAPMEKRESDAREFFLAVESRLGDEVMVERRLEFGTNVAETIVDVALDVSATAIAFCPRGGNRFARLLSGDTAARLVTDPKLPVVSLHAVDEARLSSNDSTRARSTGGGE
ncbi:Universal stress protein family protein [Halogranum rubrum]|uniref:Universal stress protein family protein n=1 Tax=Halogranum rubrum TaxID=553466 RepID=A0A1I4GTD2_9EURY|nr:universal stress protein [Halogranum rubrum]SFL32386.1 Universal stress protein family protein [Halogranum rubrum]